MAEKRFDPGVYLVTDPGLCARRGLVGTALAAVAGGATMVQLRDPHGSTRVLVEAARALTAALRPTGVPVIVNNRVDVMLAAGADGVHLGQSDMRASDARRLIGPDALVGLSITRLADLDPAEVAASDYLGIGPVFAVVSGVKPDAAPPLGLDGLSAILAAARPLGRPAVAIGGISAANAAAVVATGADGVAVVSAICGAEDATAAARALKVAVEAGRSRAA